LTPPAWGWARPAWPQVQRLDTAGRGLAAVRVRLLSGDRVRRALRL